MSVVIPIATALVGVLATALLAQYFRLARPIIMIDEISRSPDTTPRQTNVVPNLGLAAACEESELITDFLPPNQTTRISEEEYVTHLHSALEQAETAMEGLPAVHDAAQALNDCLQRSDYDEFEATFSREFLRLWPSIVGANRRGDFTYSAPPPTPLAEGPTVLPPQDPEQEPAPADPHSLASYPGVQIDFNSSARSVVFEHPSWEHEIVLDAEGEFLIPLRGPRNLAFLWGLFASPPQKPRAQELAMRTAVSFAARYYPDLQQLANFLLKVEQRDRKTLQSLRQDLEEELRGYERIVIKGNIANKGGSPVTVTNVGRLFIGLAGYSLADGTRTLKPLTADENIEMVVGAERPDTEPLFDSSVTIDAGEVTRFVAASATRMQELRYGEALLGLMTSGERRCYLGTMIVSPRSKRFRRTRAQSQLTAIYTDPQPFRDSTTDIEVPVRPPGGFSGRRSRKGKA